MRNILYTFITTIMVVASFTIADCQISRYDAAFKAMVADGYIPLLVQKSVLSNQIKSNKALIDQTYLYKPHSFTTSFNFKGQQITLELERSHLFSEGFEITNKQGELLIKDEPLLYKGRVKGLHHSLVAMTFVHSIFSVIIDTGTDIIQITKDIDSGLYQINESSSLTLPSVSCKTPEEGGVHLQRPSHSRSQASCVELSVESDYEIFLQNNSNASDNTLWLSTIVNNMSMIYEQDGVPLAVSGFILNTTPDSYSNDLTNCLSEFVSSNSGGITGNVGLLMSGKSLGGGISQGIGGYCNGVTEYPGPFAIMGDMINPIVGVPNYSYNIMIACHELGHVYGLRHTHACVWNGNNTQIDDCGNVYAADNGNTPEGTSCFDPLNPILPGSNGTIMSNCNLLMGQAVSFVEGFSVQAGAVLYDNFVNAPCETGDRCRNILPVNDACASAIPLKINQMCDFKTYDNLLVTSSGETPSISCGNIGVEADLWFSVLIPASGSVTIETGQATGGLTDMVLQTYSGTCGSLTLIDCDDNGGAGNHSLVSLSGRVPGEVVLIRVIDSGSNDEGNFDLCAYDASLPCHPDFDALIDFYNDMNGASWINNTGWIDGIAGTDCNVCAWQGVACNVANRVTEINLPANNLAGGLSNAITDLPFLARLNIYSNQITGSIPTFLNSIVLLDYVDLGSNLLTGSIPSSLSISANLRTLYLDNNNLSGTLPAELSLMPLTSFWVQNNGLSGCIPNTYIDFCTRGANLKLQNNPMLPFGGDYDQLCIDSLGADFDLDMFCGGDNDCDDTNANTYPGAPELCDGLDNDCDLSVDEGVSNVPNNWLGNSDNWHNPSTWSTGFVPQQCHDVLIDPVSVDSVIIYALSDAVAGSIEVGSNGVLRIQNFSTLTIEDRQGIINNGLVSVFGDVFINNSSSSSAFRNEGTTFIGSSGNLELYNSLNVGFLNSNAGLITNNGVMKCDSMSLAQSIGFENLGNFINVGTFSTSAIEGVEIIQRQNALFDNQQGAIIDIR